MSKVRHPNELLSVRRAIGSHGHVHPFLGTAPERRRRQHRVTLLANGPYEDLVRRLGTADDLPGAVSYAVRGHALRLRGSEEKNMLT